MNKKMFSLDEVNRVGYDGGDLYNIFIRAVSFHISCAFITFDANITAFAMDQPVEPTIFPVNRKCIALEIHFARAEYFHFTVVNMRNLNGCVAAAIT